jgi:tRNA splicing endonuclease
MRVFPLNQYVCKRDGDGNLLEIVVKENVSVLSLEPEVREIVLQQMSKEDAKSETSCDLYTHIYKLDNKKFYVCQEVKGIKIPTSIGEYAEDQLPWICLRMVRVDSEDYGRSYVEEFIGDLKSLEGLSQSLVESAAASSKMVFMVKPNSTT